MTKRNLMVAAASVSILIGATLLPAQALEVKAGGATVSVGNSSGGTKAGASVGGTKASATIGGGSNVANATVGGGGQNANVKIGSGSGPLVGARSTGNVNDGTTTNANVNLGGFLGGLLGGGGTGPGSGGGGGGGGTAPTGSVKAAFGGLSSSEQVRVKKTCGSVLTSPASYDSGLIKLCQMLRRL
ncbi:MAG TPA: hypothetical protein PKA74_09765 [Bauldia sp.]|nr:hypothetical protein [Bauldia sp.]